MTIFERIDALQGFAHNEILSLLREIAVLAGADVSVPAAPINPEAPYTIDHVEAPYTIDHVEAPVEPAVEAVAPEVVAVPVEPVVAPLEAPAAAAVSEPIVSVTDV